MNPAAVDLRSDTVTKPTPEMRQTMAEAEVGDDVFGDDPTVKALEAEVARRMGKQAGVFVASGTQSNLCALLAHCERGEEYLVGEAYHTYRYEAGGAAVLGSIQPQPLPVSPDGTLDLGRVEAAIKPDDPHFPRSRLLSLENTHDGQPIAPAYFTEASQLARRHGLAVHLDGARIFNAAAALGVPPAEFTTGADTVSVCLSKGLGAPVGSVLCGSAELISRARRWRKMLGGGMRQAGILAGAGLYALDHHLDRLAEDHRRAEHLAEGLLASGHFVIEHDPGARTNMVFATLIDPSKFAELNAQWASAGVIVRGGPSYRFVTHLDFTDESLDRTLAVLPAITRH